MLTFLLYFLCSIVSAFGQYVINGDNEVCPGDIIPGTAVLPWYMTFQSASTGILSGLTPVLITTPGTYTYSGTFTDTDINNGFCVQVISYDFSTMRSCESRVCKDNPPVDCGPMRLAEPHLNSQIIPAEQNPDLQLMPNPTSGQLTIRYRIATPQARLVIFDTRGQQVQMKEISETTGEWNLPSGTLLPGVYSCILMDGSGKMDIRKLIIL